MISREEAKKLERKAKSMMLTKEIPQGKVDIVRSIMSNGKFLDEEKNRSIIELLQNLPDKKIEPQKSPQRVDISSNNRVRKNSSFSTSTLYIGPSQSSLYISDLYAKYKTKGLFKKRWLINAQNRFGIGFKKRLIPSRKLLKVAREIAFFQDRVIARLPLVMTMILDDPGIDDPTLFNYLRIFHRWIMDMPFASALYEQIKWMDQRHFEQQLKSFCIGYFSFRELDTGTKEAIILAVETKLREMDDLKKETIHQIEPAQARADKEKRNLEREKIIYDLMMSIRSFLPSVDPAEGLLSQHLKTRYDINSLEEYCIILMEALVFQRELKQNELGHYYAVRAPRVSSTEWDYSAEYIKKIGKDSESKRKKQAEKISEMLAVLDERYQLVNMRCDSTDLVMKAFDEQWRIVNKRRHDAGDIYDRDFFTFVDETLNYFTKGYLPFIDGTAIALADDKGSVSQGAAFSRSCFENEFIVLSNLLSDLVRFRTENPNLIVTHVEIKRLVAGQIPSMSAYELFFKQLGGVFYDLARKLQTALDSHRKAAPASPQGNIPRIPFSSISADTDEPRLIPFHSFKLAPAEDPHPAYKYLTGRPLVSESLKDGIINIVTAFCFQFAFECYDRNILSDLEYRKDIKKKLQFPEQQ